MFLSFSPSICWFQNEKEKKKKGETRSLSFFDTNQQSCVHTIVFFSSARNHISLATQNESLNGFVCLFGFFFPSSLWREVYVQNPIALNCEDVDFSSLILYSLAKFGQTLSFFRLLPFPSAILFLPNPPSENF